LIVFRNTVCIISATLTPLVWMLHLR